MWFLTFMFTLLLPTTLRMGLVVGGFQYHDRMKNRGS